MGIVLVFDGDDSGEHDSINRRIQTRGRIMNDACAKKRVFRADILANFIENIKQLGMQCPALHVFIEIFKKRILIRFFLKQWKSQFLPQNFCASCFAGAHDSGNCNVAMLSFRHISCSI